MANEGDKRAIRQGLPMVETRDPEALQNEISFLNEVNSRPHYWQRWRGYLNFQAPGGFRVLSHLVRVLPAPLFLPVLFMVINYSGLQPVAILIGLIMFMAIGHQLIITRARPYDVFWKKLHPGLAIFWGINVLLASTVWQFPQYSLGTAVLQDIFSVFGLIWQNGLLPLSCWLLQQKYVGVMEREVGKQLQVLNGYSSICYWLWYLPFYWW